MISRKCKAAVLASCLVGVSHLANAADNQAANYKNQRGSVLTLTWHPQHQNTGNLTGTFKTAVGDCKQDVNVPVPISGFYNGNAVSISINFPHCRQVVAMTGNVSKDKTEINTIWLDARITKDPLHRDWDTNLIGTDFYKRQG